MSTARDRAILNSILNPFLPVGSDFEEVEPAELKDDVDEITAEIEEARKLEKEAVVLADGGMIEDALRNLTRAIEIAPLLPSLFNNRGQVYRLMGDVDKAILDLNQAILLSNGQGKSACQALCQRGLIYRRNEEDEKALADFKKAAAMGSGFAKMALVQMNPYAALCNQMLSQMMEKLTNT